MITNQDFDRRILEQYKGELDGMTVSEANQEIQASQNIIDEEEGWVEALTIWLRVNEPIVSGSQD